MRHPLLRGKDDDPRAEHAQMDATLHPESLLALSVIGGVDELSLEDLSILPRRGGDRWEE
jgi:hypothetical protein